MEVLQEAVERQMFGLDNPGFCILCGEEYNECEPDARGYFCTECEEHTIYGAEELLLSLEFKQAPGNI